MYFEDGAGWSDTNAELLHDMHTICRSSSTSFEVAGADWNMTAHDLRSRCSWSVMFPAEATLVHSDGTSCIDGFAVTSTGMLLPPDVIVDGSHRKGPHKPAQLIFPPSAEQVWKTVPATKVGLPIQVPSGRMPKPQDWSVARAAAQVAIDLATSGGSLVAASHALSCA